jgi:hypothetical protein
VARYLVTQQAHSGLRVRDVMTLNPVVVSPGKALGAFMDNVVLLAATHDVSSRRRRQTRGRDAVPLRREHSPS